MLRTLRTIWRPLMVGLACGSGVAAAVIAGQWIVNDYFGLKRFHGIGFVGPLISLVATTLLVGIIQFRGQQRRRARLARAQVVADCNHEIRNALQTMIALHYPEEELEQIRAAVRRIDWALRDLLPRLQEEDKDAAQRKWEIQNGRLRVKEQESDKPERQKQMGMS